MVAFGSFGVARAMFNAAVGSMSEAVLTPPSHTQGKGMDCLGFPAGPTVPVWGENSFIYLIWD